MNETEEVTIWFDEKGNKIAFKRMRKGGSMQKISIEELKEIIWGE